MAWLLLQQSEKRLPPTTVDVQPPSSSPFEIQLKMSYYTVFTRQQFFDVSVNAVLLIVVKQVNFVLIVFLLRFIHAGKL